mmetsp:Transcript_24172/g.39882  ORF Transcript_24172/g.39882 Transcript_24172/m.39882 type:complete len:210 (-) Transcript_24172:176-805(-)
MHYVRDRKLLAPSSLSLLNSIRKSFSRLGRKFILLIQFSSLDNCLLHQISDNSQGSHSCPYKVIFVIDFRNLLVRAGQSRFNLFNCFRVGVLTGLDLLEGLLKLNLGTVQNFILGIKLGEVVEDFDGRFGNGGEDLTNLGIGFGCVVSCGSNNGAQDGTSDSKAGDSSQETGGEFDSFFVYGNNGGSLYGRSRRGFWGSWRGFFGHEDG